MKFLSDVGMLVGRLLIPNIKSFSVIALWLHEHTLFVLIFARTNFRAFAQQNPFAHQNYYRIYAEKGYVRNLIHAKIISFHLIHLEPFQKLYFDLKGMFTSLLDLRKINMREKYYM